MSRSSPPQPRQPDGTNRRGGSSAARSRPATGTPATPDPAMMGVTSGNAEASPSTRRTSPDRDDSPLEIRVEFVVLDGPAGQELRRAQAQVMRRVLQWIAEHPNPDSS